MDRTFNYPAWMGAVPRQSAPWSDEEHAELVAGFRDGMSRNALAAKHGRRPSSLDQRLSRLLGQGYLEGATLKQLQYRACFQHRDDALFMAADFADATRHVSQLYHGQTVVGIKLEPTQRCPTGWEAVDTTPEKYPTTRWSVQYMDGTVNIIDAQTFHDLHVALLKQNHPHPINTIVSLGVSAPSRAAMTEAVRQHEATQHAENADALDKFGDAVKGAAAAMQGYAQAVESSSIASGKTRVNINLPGEQAEAVEEIVAKDVEQEPRFVAVVKTMLGLQLHGPFYSPIACETYVNHLPVEAASFEMKNPSLND